MPSHKNIMKDRAFWGGLDKTAQLQFVGQNDKPGETVVEHDTNHNGEFADWLQERGDPRHVIVRGALPERAFDIRPGRNYNRPGSTFAPVYHPESTDHLPSSVRVEHFAPVSHVVNVHSGVALAQTLDYIPGKGWDQLPVLRWHIHVPRTVASGPGRSATYTTPVTREQLRTYIAGLPKGAQRLNWVKYASAHGWLPRKLARLGKENVYFPPTVKKRDFYKFLTQIDPRDTGGGWQHVNKLGDTNTAPGVFADWLEEHGDWRHSIARAAVARSSLSTNSYSPYPDYTTRDGKQYKSTQDLTSPENKYQYSLYDYTTAKLPDTNVYGTGLGERRGGRYGHSNTSHITFRLARSDEAEPALHVSWTHRVPASLTPAGKLAIGNGHGQTHASATIHAIMSPEQVLDMARNAPTETIRNHLYHVLQQFKEHTGWKMKLARPAAVIGSTQHQKKLEIARRILQEAGISPATVKAVIANGDQAGVLQMLHGNVHPALARYVAAWFGLLSGEKSLTVFHPAQNGEDFLHVITTRYPPDQLSKYLHDSGAPQFSVENTGTGSRAYLYNPLGKYDVSHVLKGLPDASHSRFVGFGSRIGGSSGAGADARAAFRTVIRDFDSTDKPAAPRQGSADVHLARLADTRPFKPSLIKLWQQARLENRPILSIHDQDRAEDAFYAASDHDVLADHLDDHNDPRADIVRKRVAPRKTSSLAWEQVGAEVKQTPFGVTNGARFQQYPLGHTVMSDGTHIWFTKYSRAKPGKEPVWMIGWSGPVVRHADLPSYTTVMGHQQFKNWLRRFDPDELSRIVKGMRNGR